MAGRSRKTGQVGLQPVTASIRQALAPSSPVNAFWTVTCWSRANPIRQRHQIGGDERVGLVSR
jgi:hypothetical protein